NESALAAVDGGLARADHGGGPRERTMAAEVAVEAAWLGLLDVGAAADRYRRLIDGPTVTRGGWPAGRLAFWANRLGLEVPDVPLPEPVAVELSGDAAKAATLWREIGCPVEAAIAEAFAPDADLNDVFATLDENGAVGSAAGLRRRLREAGVTGIPRGPQASTDAHPAGLTARQQEVLALVAAGYSDAAIASELFISPKTASHHVSAVIRKLGVENRVQAASMAHTSGWVEA
ncbi:MAG: LuxR C-terminal-related transcriptional regulator, partial [Acidimicrobiia bacterium]|nr:LuxR C-terminal-related transcriptional regulator [Acidimicrobiia bacterium]